jgi:hypothetical protein
MQTLRSTLSKINDWVQERLPISLTTPMHPYRGCHLGKGMECPTIKTSLERPFCYFVYPYHSSLDPLQLSQASFSQVGVHP